MHPPPPPPPPGAHLETIAMVPEPQASPLLVMMNIINSLTHMLLGAVACSSFILVQLGLWSASFSQHVYLCVTGYIILMSVAIMSYDPNTSWSRHLKYQEKKTSHILLQIVGSVLAITGSIIRIKNLNTNFETTHGILGLVAMILTMMSLIGGLINLFLSGSKNSLLLKTVHSCVGSLALVIAFICLCFGFDNVYRAIFGNAAANMSISFTIFALVGVLLPPVVNTFNRIFN
ncbi:uncharacterized protein LOC128677701 [Plodia interpunctella]|uniref:uncharacterized protein LOC128677701 n=1 Tax=Plodia interpunctella TaxID=58824 RepID=UPI002367496D|nr:uncharacterized protein LOC128677701 [Plodia interpunctella]